MELSGGQVSANQFQYLLIFGDPCDPIHENVIVHSINDFGEVEFNDPTGGVICLTSARSVHA